MKTVRCNKGVIQKPTYYMHVTVVEEVLRSFTAIKVPIYIFKNTLLQVKVLHE